MLTAMPTPLITATELNQLLSQGSHDVVLFDCSFDLADPAAGREAYHQGHLPGPTTSISTMNCPGPRPDSTAVIRCPMRSCSPRGCGRLA